MNAKTKPNAPALTKGQILRVKVFQERAGLGDWAWRKLRNAATEAGVVFWYKVGNATFVDCDRFAEYLQNSRSE
ncbi:hypothetical protein Fuma_06244 [Fuerstiella marisgermanici]|uniref:DNA-binding protein n=1 Tax=Fuerstiella marisgermanici TaxID=1891926 RepID=A0A1P8WR90_9PLAN|nr:hypothetical protein Fuma_06244 [Fuerstiella marisgermanici]